MYKYLLFDADNTLLDFDAAERAALYKTLSEFLPEVNDEICGAAHGRTVIVTVAASDVRPRRSVTRAVNVSVPLPAIGSVVTSDAV